MASLNIYGKSKLVVPTELEALFDLAIRTLGDTEKTVNLVLVSEKQIKELNKKYRKKDKVTDVLSFIYNEEDMLGEVIICTAKIREQARENKILPKEELNKIFIHGIVHLYGYDHEKGERDRIIMEKKEGDILSRLKATQ